MSSNKVLLNQTAVVTGAIGDLGNAMVVALAEAGAQLVLWDIYDESEVAEKIERVRDFNPSVRYFKVDVTDRSAVDNAISELKKIDIVCSNAGISQAQEFLDISLENWQKQLDVNLTGCFNVGQSAARKMLETSTKGSIIFTSSWVANIPWPELTAYTVSKAGVNMLTKQMARELASHKIRVNAISPGIVDAGLARHQLREEPQYAARAAKVIPLGAPGSPEDIAQAIVYIASPAASYMTGSIMTLDGGCSLFQFDA